jgi:hypothetical protein
MFTGTDVRWLVVGTSENTASPGLRLIDAARAASVPSLGVVDFAANAGFRFRGRSDDALAHAPEWLAVPDEWTAREYAALGFSRKHILIVGHPHYDAVTARRTALEAAGRPAARQRALPGVPHDRSVIVFVSEISTGLDPQQFRWSPDYTLRGRDFPGGVKAEGRTEIVVEEFLDAVGTLPVEARPYLVLRRHPKEGAADLARYVGEFDRVSVGGDAQELIFAADAAAGMTSMLLEEAFLLGVPAISIGPRPAEKEWLPAARDGKLPCAWTRHDLRARLRTLLASSRADRSAAVRRAPQQGVTATAKVLEFLRDRNGQ